MSHPIRRRPTFASTAACGLLAACVALFPLAAPAQPAATAQPPAFAAAQEAYDIGHYAEAYAGFAALADAGHAEAARIALLMQRHGQKLYGMRFAAGPKQIGRWSALLGCRDGGAVAGCRSGPLEDPLASRVSRTTTP